PDSPYCRLSYRSKLSWPRPIDSCGRRIGDTFRQIGVYTGRILKGAKPADLRRPIEQVRAGHQHADLQDARAHRATVAPRHRRLGDRITTMFAALHESASGTNATN